MATPPGLRLPRDGEYSQWERELIARYPLTLTEMRSPSVPFGRPDTEPLARWGIEIHAGWRPLVERLLDRLEAAIAVQPAAERHRFRIVQVKEKLGQLTVYLAEGTPEMRAAIAEAAEASVRTCEVCGAAARLEERRGWFSARCPQHERWTPWERLL